MGRNRISILVVCLLGWVLPNLAAADGSVLTLEDAVALALANNRSIEQSALNAGGIADALAAARTQRLPQFKFSSITGTMISRPTITFEKGSFGEYPGIGPI